MIKYNIYNGKKDNLKEKIFWQDGAKAHQFMIKKFIFLVEGSLVISMIP